MRIAKFLAVLSVALLVSGCACRSRGVGEGEGNIPLAEAGKELKDVNFAFDSSELDASARDILKRNAAWLSSHADIKVQIEGHCDERGTNEYNMALGDRRANSVMSFMKSLGMAAGRMSTISYGEELPLNPGHNEAAWSANRRAHFKAMQ